MTQWGERRREGTTVGKRGTVPWAATSMPDIRRQWCHAIDAVADYSWDVIDTDLPPQAPAQLVAMSKRVDQMKAKLASVSSILKDEVAAIRSAQLYWVARNTVDTVMHAAETLPEWTPAIAAPAPTGFLCWAKSAGTTTWATPSVAQVEASLTSGVYSATPLGEADSSTELPWDGIVWWTRPDGLMQLMPCSRDSSAATMLRQARVSSPVWGSHTIMLNPAVPRTAEVQKSADAHHFVSGLGAAWLLMGQENVTETRTIGRPATPAPPSVDTDAPDAETAPTTPPAVTIVELCRRTSPTDRSAGSGKHLNHRIPVEGYWRQQPCGPRNSQRRPQYISDYVKGPANAPLVAKERVHVLRHRPGTELQP